MKVLVAYESKHGSTKAIAERIAATLADHGLGADARSMDELSDLGSYDAFVFGSAVYYGRWMKQAVDFVRGHALLIVDKPVWLFSSGPVGTPMPADPKDIALLRATIKPRDHHVFHGALDRDNLSIGERLVVSVVKAPDGDFRDWDDVEQWATGIARRLDGSSLVPA
jgi:menaquinone-dependent protoporphyrinogen oxidase